MGLLSRIGKEFGEQFGQSVPHHRWGDTLGLQRQALSLPQMAGVPLTSSLMGAGAGAAFGAAGGGDVGEGAMQGAMMGGAAGAAGVAPLMMKRMVIAIARALKQQRPDLPDEAILQEAQKRAQTLGGQQLQDVYQRNFGEQLSPELADLHARGRQP